MFKEVVPSLLSLDPFLRLQAFSYWSRKSPQFVVPNSQQESLLLAALLATGEGFKSPS